MSFSTIKWLLDGWFSKRAPKSKGEEPISYFSPLSERQSRDNTGF